MTELGDVIVKYSATEARLGSRAAGGATAGE
jgi:hypothetical protein